MVRATNLGYPRIGPKRELKKALEKYWSGGLTETELDNVGRKIRQDNWRLQKELGIHHIPSNDFSLYDHVLDTAAMVGAVPSRFRWDGERVDLTTYFAMARGVQEKHAGSTHTGKAQNAPAMEMTKWFDTNYHYIVPEFEKSQTFRLASTRPVDMYLEAKSLGIETRPVLLGPISFLLLGKSKDPDVEPISLLDDLLFVYDDVLQRLAQAGAEWVQIDEPCLVLDLDPKVLEAFKIGYSVIEHAVPDLKILIATYFGELRENLDVLFELPGHAVHLDLVRGPDQLDETLSKIPDDKILSLGVVNGRNIWKTDLAQTLPVLKNACEALGPERVWVGPSCSLLHSPVDVSLETKLDEELRSWLAFSKQKCEEIVTLARAFNEGEAAVENELTANREAVAARSTSTLIHNDEVKKRTRSVSTDMLFRHRPFPERRDVQRETLCLPVFPTTTIGSFPQTKEVRAARAEFRSGKRDASEYEKFLEEEIEKTIRFQEEIGLDVLVHGESERNDMVEYFGEQLSGFAFTKNGWVQSYGSRCVKPPIIFGDIQRPAPMTLDWARYAQSLTEKPVKGMLTGPVTILQWSFVRNDQPRSETCRQIALAIRDEVLDLETAGIRVIQIDEPALREGFPLRRDQWESYLEWAVEAFRIASSGVRDETQIHTHMCYSEFNEIIEAISEMDADVISIEASRSQMELLSAFKDYHYPNEIGPGVYDIHSPRVPTREEIVSLLEKAVEVLDPGQLWVNPDCGLKTRRWEEVRPSLAAMVEAARMMRSTAQKT
ncbi:MAG: 5-methyltetrahydropteroyltriglutamate--homocysteine S-methyltransferase [Candidatus Latescibacterota bacterium]|nr:MAG: 5-methyltetrahydropteroyltriglutamate--homocysteine S-methyltransferase [Candidatus Latescibacterota bacterium]